jgi:tRNA-specific 2-thiouridylase
VVQPFVESYLQGRTPIPCVACNEDVKFGFLLRRARALGAKLATGHYARIAEDGVRRRLLRAKDLTKDQSYFLFTLGQEALRDVIFPVGELSKAEVRAVAERRGLPTSHKPESMEICFVPDGNYAGFVERVAGPQPAGTVVNEAGETLGRHSGIHHFTVGQRRGLGVSAATPLYVERIDAARHQVVVGPVAALERERFTVLKPAWVDACPAPDETIQVRIRHRHAGAAARVTPLDGGRVSVELLAPVRAVTPGQAAVFYRDAEVLGGGWIG